MLAQFIAGSLAAFATLSFIVPTYASAGPSPAEEGIVLKPLRVDTFEKAAGLRVRSAVDFSRLSLTDKAQLVYGSQGEHGQVHLANMTLYAPNGLMIITMEAFEGLTSKVDCKGDDGTISLTFKSQDAQDYALEKWAWINEDADQAFIMIANHDGCGPDGERQAYTISNVEQVDGTLTTSLSAKPAPWDQVAGTFDLDFGRLEPPKGARRRRLRRWGPLDDALESLGDIAEGAKDAATGALNTVGDAFANIGDADLEKAVTFAVSAGKPGARSNIFTDTASPPRLELDCVNCYLKGSFQVNGKLSVDNFQLKALTLETSPVGVEASLELEAVLNGNIKGPQKTFFNQSKELFSAPIPGAGIKVPKIFKLGASISLDVTAGASISGTGNFTFGLAASLPNSAKITTNIVDPAKSSQTGMKVDFDPKFKINALSAPIGVSAAAQPKLSFGVEIVKVGKLDAFLALDLPKVTADLTPVFDASGACSTASGSPDKGVKLESKISVGLSAGADATIGKKGTALPSLSKSLFTLERPLLKKCFPLGK